MSAKPFSSAREEFVLQLRSQMDLHPHTASPPTHLEAPVGLLTVQLLLKGFAREAGDVGDSDTLSGRCLS